jgi:hypothetical protein
MYVPLPHPPTFLAPEENTCKIVIDLWTLLHPVYGNKQNKTTKNN